MQEQAVAGREEVHRQEVAALRLRLEQADTRHEDLAESVGGQRDMVAMLKYECHDVNDEHDD